MKPTDWIIAGVLIFAAVYIALQCNERMEEARYKNQLREAAWIEAQQNGGSSAPST